MSTSMPSFRLSDVWQAPAHDFPLRDEILYQYMPVVPGSRILEIGPGSGFTAFRLRRRVGHMTLIDPSQHVIDDLDRRLGNCNIACVRAAGDDPDLTERLEGTYQTIYGLDCFEYVADPGACLANAYRLLAPGGEMFLTFPNVPPPAGDGVTWFLSSEQIGDLLRDAGFRKWEIFPVSLRRYASKVYWLLHDRPLDLFRKRRKRTSVNPQVYDDTWAFQHRRLLWLGKVPLHLAWLWLAVILRLGGSMFEAGEGAGDIQGRQIVIRAWKD